MLMQNVYHIEYASQTLGTLTVENDEFQYQEREKMAFEFLHDRFPVGATLRLISHVSEQSCQGCYGGNYDSDCPQHGVEAYQRMLELACNVCKSDLAGKDGLCNQCRKATHE